MHSCLTFSNQIQDQVPNKSSLDQGLLVFRPIATHVLALLIEPNPTAKESPTLCILTQQIKLRSEVIGSSFKTHSCPIV
jgi:hypothetical protein